jgi:hypothetical protein
VAKQKKKKRSHKKGYPPLSKTDKFITTIIPIVTVIFMYTILLGYEWFSPYFIFRQNSEALAFCETSSFLRIVPFWIVCFVIFGIIFFRSTSKKPIFGNKKIDYYNTTFYKFVLPPFDKRYTKLFWTKEKIRNVLIKTTVMALLIIITFIYGLGGVISRWEITDSNIMKFGTDNEIKKCYAYDDIISYEVYSTLRSTHGKHATFYSELGFAVTLNNEERLCFNLDSINGGIRGLYKLDKLLSGKNKTVVDDRLERYINTHSLSDEELKMLTEIYA